MARSRSDSEADRDDRVPTDCRAILDRTDDAPDTCTIYDASIPRRITTTWITAEEGSFVALEEMR